MYFVVVFSFFSYFLSSVYISKETLEFAMDPKNELN